MIIYRKRVIDSNTFYEYLVLFKNGLLVLPEELPERYKGRTMTLQYVYGIAMREVDSTPFSECEEFSMARLEKSSGIWIVRDDCVEKGHYTPDKIPGKAQYFSVPIDYMTRLNIDQAALLMRDTGPTVLYHGTELTNVESIRKEGLKSTLGMLGWGVYLGTFWKATRYACLTQDYKPQSGSVFRVFAFPTNIIELPSPSWKCTCGCSTPDIADHTLSLKNDIHVSQSHLSKDGRIKNEEWVIKGKTFLQQCAKINEATFPSPHYDPTFRGTLIN